eukprot:TRINITY_DN12748_c0_g1_i1.p1 TRINITY_DN12748_c0_g1~~TRINITY_DN12748_c0_g1_i1.p1  ORF type:complete len:176 (-),score=7.02 TRINITY_DN12748_c0_g1_i1:498-1025(-)
MGACTSKISKRRPSPRESEEDAQSEDNMKTERNESNQSPALDIHMMETPNFGALRIDELLRKLDDRNFYKRNIKRWTIKEFLMGIDLIESRDSLMALATALINKVTSEKFLDLSPDSLDVVWSTLSIANLCDYRISSILSSRSSPLHFSSMLSILKRMITSHASLLSISSVFYAI